MKYELERMLEQSFQERPLPNPALQEKILGKMQEAQRRKGQRSWKYFVGIAAALTICSAAIGGWFLQDRLPESENTNRFYVADETEKPEQQEKQKVESAPEIDSKKEVETGNQSTSGKKKEKEEREDGGKQPAFSQNTQEENQQEKVQDESQKQEKMKPTDREEKEIPEKHPDETKQETNSEEKVQQVSPIPCIPCETGMPVDVSEPVTAPDKEPEATPVQHMDFCEAESSQQEMQSSVQTQKPLSDRIDVPVNEVVPVNTVVPVTGAGLATQPAGWGTIPLPVIASPTVVANKVVGE